MKAEIVSIGDEMTSGQRLDTNSQWLSQQLAELGISTQRHTTVADDLKANVEVFQSAAQRASIIIATGGLGPTQDDLTREALAQAFGLSLQLDPSSLAHIEALFARRSRPMPERNRIQAMFPQGSVAIPNPHGTAPGIDLTIAYNGPTCRIFALPGVPAEMRQMWELTVAPRIADYCGLSRQVLRYHTIKVFGIGESDVEARLPDLMRRDRFPRVGITVSQATISLRIVAEAADDTNFNALIGPTIAEIETALSSLVFGTGDEELEDAVVRLLCKQNLSLATLEIGPANFVGHWMLQASQAVPGAFAGGLAFPSLDAAMEFFFRASDSEIAQLAAEKSSYTALAQAVQERFAADIGLAFGPYPNVAGSAAGPLMTASNITFAIAIKGRSVRCKTLALGGHPDVILHRIAKTALDHVRLRINAVSQALED